jgi:hydroxycarboxylate dehydrogenase B
VLISIAPKLQRPQWLRAPAPGFAEVMVAGDPEWRAEAERAAHGIPIPDGTWAEVIKAAARVGVPPIPVE